MHCFPECAVRRILAEAGTETRIVDVQFTNTGAKDFNGKLVYLRRPLASGYLGKQYCVVKSAPLSSHPSVQMKLFTIRQLFFATFRRRRMRRFYATLRPTSQTRLLDIGGDPHMWIFESRFCEPVPVTPVNRQFPNAATFNNSRFTAVEGDAIDLPFENQSFDIVYSNSVIEHLTAWERQQAFASEARRVAKSLWIQTPARHFPIQPHLLTPFVQYLPRQLQVRLARHLTLWGMRSKPNAIEVNEFISEIRLLTLREMKLLFSDCLILKERVFGLTKSYIAIRSPRQS